MPPDMFPVRSDRKSSLEQELKTYDIDLEKFREYIYKQEQRVRELADLEKINKGLMLRIQDFQNSKKLAEDQIQIYSKELELYSEKIKLLETNLVRMQEELKQSELAKENLNLQVGTQSNLISIQANKIAALEPEIEKLRESIKDATRDMLEAVKRAKEAEIAYKKAHESGKLAEQNEIFLRNQLNDQESHYRHVQVALGDLTKRLESELEKYRISFNENLTKEDDLKKALREQREEKDKEIEFLKEKVKKLTQDINGLEDILRLNLKIKMKEVSKLDKEISSLKKDLDTKTAVANRITLKRTMIIAGVSLFLGFFIFYCVKLYQSRQERQILKVLSTGISNPVISMQLSRLLLSKDPKERWSAVEEIYKDPDPQTLPALACQLENESISVVKLKIIETLVKLGDKTVLPELVNLQLNSSDPLIRQVASEAVGEISEASRKADTQKDTDYQKTLGAYQAQANNLIDALNKKVKENNVLKIENQKTTEVLKGFVEKDARERVKSAPSSKGQNKNVLRR